MKFFKLIALLIVCLALFAGDVEAATATNTYTTKKDKLGKVINSKKGNLKKALASGRMKVKGLLKPKKTKKVNSRELTDKKLTRLSQMRSFNRARLAREKYTTKKLNNITKA